MVVFGCKKSGTSKGYGEREISLTPLKREGGTFSGLALLASQKWWFLVAKRVAPVRDVEKGKFLSLRLRERGPLFQGSLSRLSKVVVFGCKKSGTGWGLVKVW